MDITLDQLSKKVRQEPYSDSFANRLLTKMRKDMARAEREEENECEE